MGLLCKSGFASMGEILSLNGPWDLDLIETMLPVAMELQADEALMMYGANAAVQSKEASRAFRSGIDRIKDQSRRAMAATRGLDNVDSRLTQAADKMIAGAEKMGLRRMKLKRGQRPGMRPPPSPPTRLHGGKD